MPDAKIIHFDFPKNAKAATTQSENSHIDNVIDISDYIKRPPTKEELEKYKHFTYLISKGMVFTTIIVNTPGVKVPDKFKSEAVISLNWSHKFSFRDFIYDTAGVSGSLTFFGQPFHTVIPWKSVCVIGAPEDPSQNMVWEVGEALDK